MPREKQILSVVDGLYSTASGEKTWDEALQSVRSLHGGAVAIVFDVNRKTGAIREWVGPDTDYAKDDYINHINAINPRMHMSLQRPAGHVLTDYMIATERDMDRSEFYDWLGRIAQLRYFMGSRLNDEGDVSTFTSIEFETRQGHVDVEQLRLFRLVNRHLNNAWQMRLPRAAITPPVLHVTDEFVPWAVITLDGFGQITGMNKAGERLVMAFDGILVKGARLHTFKAADDRKLQMAIANALKAANDPLCESRFAITAARSGTATPLSIQICGCYRNGPKVPGYPSAMVYITDPDATAAPSERTLTSLFGLTGQEARLAVRLAQGEALLDAARQMGIARNTARNHLRRVFEKTGSSTQSALMRLVLRHLPD